MIITHPFLSIISRKFRIRIQIKVLIYYSNIVPRVSTIAPVAPLAV